MAYPPIEPKGDHRDIRQTHIRTPESYVQVPDDKPLISKSLIEALQRAADLHRQSASADVLVARRLEGLAPGISLGHKLDLQASPAALSDYLDIT